MSISKLLELCSWNDACDKYADTLSVQLLFNIDDDSGYEEIIEHMLELEGLK